MRIDDGEVMSKNSDTYYMATSAGVGLTNALTQMLSSGDIDEETSLIAMALFEENFPKELRSQIVTLPVKSHAVVEGKLETYNMNKDAWRVDSTSNELQAFKTSGKSERCRLYFK